MIIKRMNALLILCLAVLCLVLTACPAPGDGTIEDGAAPVEETVDEAAEDATNE